jgi:3-dehydroquinate dehydratase/shikimate dehydrogenase
MGHYGVYSRILAEHFGSFLSYTSALSEPDAPVAAPGQIEVHELASLYRLRSITESTRIYGVAGYPLKATSSPPFFNTIFNLEGANAVYVPFPADSISDFIEMAKELHVEGISVTVPYKEAVIPFLNSMSDEVRDINACNTLSLGPYGWLGTNTDTWGFSDSLLAFLDRQNLKRQRVTVIGAGGAAKAVVHELHRLGAKVLILNRTAHKARQLATPYKFAWGGLDDREIEMVEKYRDIIIQTTSAGMEGIGSGNMPVSKSQTNSLDPLASYNFCGRETVMDLIYKPEMTPFLTRAAKAGCRVQNGYDMLLRQARYQYAQFTGEEIPEHLFARVQFGGTKQGAQ